MARSRAIDIRLERLVPAMEEYFVKGVFTKDELRDIAKQRTSHEYKLVARPLLYVDVRKAIDFELELEARVAKFLQSAEVQIKNRNAIVERIVHIYDIAIPSICKGGVSTTKQQNLERDSLELQYLTFLRDFNRDSELSKYLASELQRSPSNVNAWVFSVEWELSKGNIDNARSIAQESLKQCSSSSPKVWTALMTVETTFAAQLARGILETDKTTTKAAKTKKKNSAEEDAAESDNEQKEEQEHQEEKLPLSQRYHKINQALSSIVVDGALIQGACTAALQSPIGGVELLEDVRSSLLLENVGDKNMKQQQQIAGAEMCGRFIAKYLFAECARQQLNKSSTTPAAAEEQQQQQQQKVVSGRGMNLNLVAAAIVDLIRAPFDYFFASSSAFSSKHQPSTTTSKKYFQQNKNALSHQFWSTATYLDENPSACPAKLPQQKNNKKEEENTNNNSNNSKTNTLVCIEGLAHQTLAKLIEFSRATAHPVAVKSALQFAEEIFFEKKILTKQQISGLFSTISAVAKKAAASTSSLCCPACQQAFNECAVEEYNPLVEKMKTEMTKLNNNNNNNNGGTELLLISKWISGEFKTLLEKEQNINIIVSLAPQAVLGEQEQEQTTEQDSASSSSLSLSSLDGRLRFYLSNLSSSKNKTSSSADLDKLATDLNSWFQQQFGKTTSSTNQQRSTALFGSEAISNQVTTMLLGRAIVHMNKNKQNLPLRRDRDAPSDSDDDDSATAGNNQNAAAISGFNDIITLFKLTQPTTPKQIEIRANAVSLIASVWLEMTFLSSSTSQQQHHLTFPFVTLSTDNIIASSSMFVETIKSTNKNNNTNKVLMSILMNSTRNVIATCGSVLPPAMSFLVDIAATIEFLFALNHNSNSAAAVKTSCITKMRQYFESAVSQNRKNRTTWQTWKQFETKLGNLKEAGDIQRRASQALNDSRLL